MFFAFPSFCNTCELKGLARKQAGKVIPCDIKIFADCQFFFAFCWKNIIFANLDFRLVDVEQVPVRYLYNNEGMQCYFVYSANLLHSCHKSSI